MTDLVERINEAWLEKSRSAFDCANCGCEANMMMDAVDEIQRLLERNKLLEAVYEAASLHVEQFTPYALHTLDLRNALAAVQTKQESDDKHIEEQIAQAARLADYIEVEGYTGTAYDIRRLRDTMQAMLDVVWDTQNKINAQAEDAGLWFIARTAPEAYVQQELRALHVTFESALDKLKDEMHL